jgi:hypothetical protein
MVKCAGVLLEPREFPWDFFWGYMKENFMRIFTG